MRGIGRSIAFRLGRDGAAVAVNYVALLEAVEHHHADLYTEALTVLKGGAATAKQATQKWICKQCSVIYDPILGDPDSGSAEAIIFGSPAT